MQTAPILLLLTIHGWEEEEDAARSCGRELIAVSVVCG